ncbi:MAG: amidohydrolase [Clostridia bacterium]|nr:amidohydrolase [Clostridia bacterium]
MYYAIDAHCHIYPDRIAERAIAGTDVFYGTHALCNGKVSDLLERAGKAGIDHAIVQSVATAPKQVQSINNFIAEAVKESDGRLTGLGTLHPDSEDQVGDVKHLLELGLKGVKLHPDIQKFKIDDYRMLKIFDLCEEAGIPILMHAGDDRYDFSNPNRMKPILEIYKNLTVVGAHFGGWTVWDEAVRELSAFPNFFVDCSSSFPFISAEKVKELICGYGADKVLFGTDYPMWEPQTEIDALLSLGLSREEYQMIFSENAKRVFSL